MNAVMKRYTAQDLYNMKLRVLEQYRIIEEGMSSVKGILHSISSYPDRRVEFTERDGDDLKRLDRSFWWYVVKMYHLEKYLLCSEYERLINDVEGFRTPEFTPENVEAWVTGLKSLVQNGVKELCKRVYQNLIGGYYYTGSGYRAPKKKRNNNGVDKRFILTTNDISTISTCSHAWRRPTVTDDLEKVCYLMDGKTVPEQPLKDRMMADKVYSYDIGYFSVKFCQNGNTHYVLSDKTRELLNRICPDGTVLGEDIKIKEL